MMSQAFWLSISSADNAAPADTIGIAHDCSPQIVNRLVGNSAATADTNLGSHGP